MLSAYLASPLGFTESGRYWLEHQYRPALRAVVEIIDPWDKVGERALPTTEDPRAWQLFYHTVGQENLQDIRRAELFIVLLEGQELDAGSMVELGYAVALGKPCFALRSDMRQHGEQHMAVNLQVESVILDSGGGIADDLGGLVGLLQEFLQSSAD